MAYELTDPFVSLADLYLYQKRKDEFKVAQARYLALRHKCDQVVDDYARNFVELIADIKRLENEILNSTKGRTPNKYGIETDGSLYREKSASQTSVDRYICKPAYRALARTMHPDRGGDPQVFAAISEAYRTGDIDALERYRVVAEKEYLFRWRVEYGIAFWENQKRKVMVKDQVFKAHPLFKLVRYHISGQHDKAREHLRMYLMLQATSLTKELRAVQLKGRP